jgi:diguanylate cyclase (GGDEF)-like protein
MPKAKTFFPKTKEIAHMGVISTSGDSTIYDAVCLMESSNLSDVIFETQSGHAIFTVDDLMFFRASKRNFNLKLNEISVPKLEYVSGEENVLNLMPKFDDSTTRYLGVTDTDKKLIGIVSLTDIMGSVDPVLMMERKKLADILNKRQIDIVSISNKTEEVLSKLVNSEDAVLISDESGLAGIITTKDAIRLMKQAVDTQIPIQHYMSAPVQTIHREETVKTAIEFLKEKGFKRAIVIDDQGKVDGIVTQRELINITYGRWAELMKLHAHELGELVHVLESENQQLKVESLTDTLTGVGNRRRFNQILESEIGRYYRQDMTPFSILMLDIDFFKKINDTHGHLVGDQILNALCKRISALLRVSDEITRWGGEEFAVILPTASSKSALALAERMRADVAQNPFGDIKVSISIGAAEYHRGESLEELLHRADQALYAAKQGGRNKVVLAE